MFVPTILLAQDMDILRFPVDGELAHLHGVMEVLTDTNGKIGKDEVRNRTDFVPYEKWDGMDFDAKAYWIRFRMENEGTEDRIYFLNTGYFFQVASFFAPRSGSELIPIDEAEKVEPNNESFSENYRANLVKVPLPAKSQRTFYLKLSAPNHDVLYLSRTSFSEGFDLYTVKGIKQTFLSLRNHSFLLSGILLLMFMFNSLMAFRTRKQVYLWLAVYNLVFCLTYLNIYGYIFITSSGGGMEISRSLQFIFPVLIVLAYSMFTLNFLELQKYSPTIYKVMLLVNALILSTLIWLAFGYYFLAILNCGLTTILGFSLVYFSIFRTYKHRSVRKKLHFYIAASTMMLVFFLNFLMSIWVESRDYYLAELLVQVAGAVEILMFTYIAVDDYVVAQKKVVSLDVQKRMLESQKEQMEEEIALKSKELVSRTTAELAFHQQQKEILNLLEEMQPESNAQLRKAINRIRQMTGNSNFADNFLIHFNGVHVGFSERLQTLHPNLTANDIKLCAYIRMNLSSLEIAQLQGVEKSSINQARYRIRKKIELERGTDLFSYLKDI